MKYYSIHFKSGGQTELSESEYNRFKNKARANEIMELQNGNLMSLRDGTSWDWIEVRESGEIETHSFPMEDAPTFEEVIHPELREKGQLNLSEGKEKLPPNHEIQEKGKEKLPEGEVNEPENLLTRDEVKFTMDRAGLSLNEFAESIGYSPQTVRMIIKEGRISQPLSDKIREVYPD